MFSYIKKLYKYRKFTRGSIFGAGTIFDYSANCINCSGDKKAIVIGDNCLIRGILKVVGNGEIHIGNNTYLGGASVIGAVENVFIGNDVIISTDVHIYDNNNHPTSPVKRVAMSECGDYFGPKWQWTESDHASITIMDNVWIGERATILKGVTIGKGAVVGCNSVVTHDVPEYSVVAGNPAKVVKTLKKDENNGEE
ncbi:MAG: acyltransferase [Streptococcus suis]